MDAQLFSWTPQNEEIFSWFAKDQEYFNDYDINIDVEGNLIVRARAGTGKTTCIIEGVKRAPEKRILIAAFSKIIQEELDKRLGKEFRHIIAKTLHAIGLSCIRNFRDHISIDFSSFRADSITDMVCDRRVPDAVKKLVTKLHTKAREIAPHACKPGDLIDLALRFDCEPEEQWALSGFDLNKIEEYALAALEAAANVKSGDTIDGSDMIFLPLRNGWLTPMFDLVVVDEAQDMTPAQLEIAMGVLVKGGRMCIVGDNRQAIFSWRGADVDALDRLKELLRAGELGLTKTFRCGKRIVNLARGIVPDFEAASSNPEGEIVSIHPSDLTQAAGPNDFILSRTNAPLVPTAMKLLRAGKRTRIAGKDIGKGLVGLVRKMRASTVDMFLVRVASWEERELNKLRGMLVEATNGRRNTIQSKIDDIIEQAMMLSELADGAETMSDIEDRIVALFTETEKGVEEGIITCSSIHRAKGLEAKRVFILENTLRNYNEEEMNLQYVAITRAKQTLVFVNDGVDAN
jgi:DNA helicase II / ATP-dependent DNA helicase PcrA